jgi:hypothetical protein
MSEIETTEARLVKVGDRLAWLGYVESITATDTNIHFELRSKPRSPTGLLRGVPLMGFDINPTDRIAIGDPPR